MCAARRPTVTELFSGSGLFGVAFAREGFRLKTAFELDPRAVATYRENVGPHCERADLATRSPNGRCDVLIAGPPCQSFSTLNRSRLGDVRERLPLIVGHWAKVTKPKIVVIENVAPFVTSLTYRRLARRLQSLGYFVTSAALDAANFGAAQRRIRSFTIASVVELAAWNPMVREPRSVLQAWKGLSDEPNGVNQHIAPPPSDIALRRMKVIPAGGDKRDVLRKRPDLACPSWKHVRSEVTDVWGRMLWNEPSNTIRTCFQNASKGRYIHPEQHRVISLREAARLQGFPDDFEFTGVPAQVARQIGNAVPLSLGIAIARRVRDIF
jgi:DNA (cytosine-5)-methyltransferase 1